MDRKTVLLDEAQLERQREYTRQLAALHQQRGKPVYALVDTFGCQQNVADSQHILGMLRDMGCQFTDDAAQADIVVLNTCAIRDHAEKRVYGNLGALTHTKKQNPEQVICLCGCMAQRPEVAEKVRQSYRHVDLVFGPQALWKFPELLYQVYTRRGRVFSVEDEHGTIAEGDARGAGGQRPGVGVYHVRVQQLLLILHRPLRPGPGAQPGASVHHRRHAAAGRRGV